MASMTTRELVRFDEYELDLGAIELRREGQVVAIEPQVFDVLSYLVAERDRVVPKTELLDNIWGDRFVSESALTSRIKSARQAVGDDGRSQRMIRTAHGRGYQFIGRVLSTGNDGPATLPQATTTATGGRDHAHDKLVGRETELGTTLDQLRTGRLVTLVGPGGVGKTRLATEVSRIWEDAGDRTVFVQLEDVTEVDLLFPRICSAVGLHPETEVDLFALLTESLRDDAVLLVLDNFEQLTPAGGEVGRLVAALPRLRVLVTSRDRLRLSAERTVEISPLDTTGGDEHGPPASVLFEQFARQADPGFRVTGENQSTVAAICELVDGLPLALGLAAAQLRYLSLDYLETHLEANIGSIAERLHDRPERQHSVTRLMEWSYRLLTPSQQQLFERLSVFAGGWSLEGAKVVGRLETEFEALDALASLVDKSLIRSEPVGRAPRFSMLNLIAAYASSQLGDGEPRLAAYRDHLTFVTDMTRSIEEERWSRRAGTWIEDLDVEHANILAALQRAVDLDRHDLVGRIVGDLNMWWYRTGRHVDGRRWIERALAGLDELELQATGRIHLTAGFMAFSDRDIDRARHHYERAIDAAGRAGDWRYEQQALAYLSATSIRRPDEFDEALRRVDAVVEAARARNEQALLAQALNVSGVLLRFSGEPELARARYEAARETNSRIGARYQEAMNLGNLAHLAGSVDEVDEALAFARSALLITSRIGSQVMSAWTIGVIAGLHQRSGSFDVAAKLLSASTAVLESLGAHRGTVADQSSPEETRAALRDELGDARLEELGAEGRALTLEAAVELALQA